MKEEQSVKKKGPRSTGRGKGKSPSLWPFPEKLLSYPSRPPTADRYKTATPKFADMMIEVGEAPL